MKVPDASADLTTCTQEQRTEDHATPSTDCVLRLSFVGLVIWLLIGFGIGFLAWGTIPRTTVPGTVGPQPQGAATADGRV